MKKILCLILIMLLVPCTVMFNGCGDKGYDLSKLDDRLKEMADKYDCIVMNESGLGFSYDSFTDINDPYINTIIATKKPYTYLNDYNTLFTNLMAFTNAYADECSNNSINASAELRNQLEQDLKDLDNSLASVENNTKTWAKVVKGAYKENDVSTEHNCLTRYKVVLDQYDDLFLSATNLSNTLSKIYFECALTEANPDVSKVSISDYDARITISKLDARLKYEITNLTQCYIEINIAGDGLSEQLVNASTGYGSLNLYIDDYLNKVARLTLPADYNWSVAIEIANNKKASFYDEAIKLYNIQEVFDDNVDRFITACNDIDYREVIVDSDASDYELLCVDNINSHNYLVNQYYNTLNALLVNMGA